MRISIVIPVYNESEQITACLRAIACQTTRPYQVIVVDNNSTDGTAVLAAQFPFVTVLHESRQGVVYARDRGFNAATGDIIGRIDADTIIADNWVETVRSTFMAQNVDIVTGSITLRDTGAAKLAAKIDTCWRRYFAYRLQDHMAIQGANMAIRRKAWLAIRREVCHEADMHEDFDIGIHVYHHGFTAAYIEHLQANICHRQVNSSFKAFSRYALVSPRTYRDHGCREGNCMYPAVGMVIVLHPLLKLLFRGYDRQLGRFSLTKLLVSTPTRVNPATFVD